MKKYTLLDAQNIARARGGECLDNKYVNVHEYMHWQCSEVHKWRAKFRAIIQGQWCPHCQKSYGERLTRLYFEEIFKEKFPTKKPSWLRSEKGKCMELDGYSAKLGIAFEYQGEHHFKKGMYGSGEKRLNLIKQRDALKVHTCAKKGVKLTVIPYTVKEKSLLEYIYKELGRNGIAYKKIKDLKKLDKSKIYISGNIDKMRKIAEERGGKCLSKYYVDAHTNLIWKCKIKEHSEWPATPMSVVSGSWCSECARNKKLTLKKAQDLARSRGGNCLSAEYINANTKMLWQCGKKHPPWEQTYAVISVGKWCPDCSRNRKGTVEQMQELARKLGGKCLSKVYMGNHKKLKWQCGAKHKPFLQTPAKIKIGRWCKDCKKT